jgi:hypothetical protein
MNSRVNAISGLINTPVRTDVRDIGQPSPPRLFPSPDNRNVYVLQSDHVSSVLTSLRETHPCICFWFDSYFLSTPTSSFRGFPIGTGIMLNIAINGCG